MYIARQLSFTGVTFKVEELPLSDDFIRMYDESVQLWVDARVKFQQALEIMTSDKRLAKTMWGQFWSSHQRFFKYLCIAAKVPHVVRITREAIKDEKVVSLSPPPSIYILIPRSYSSKSNDLFFSNFSVS